MNNVLVFEVNGSGSSPKVYIKLEMKVHPDDESQSGQNACPAFHCYPPLSSAYESCVIL